MSGNYGTERDGKIKSNDPQQDKTNKITCVPSKDSEQPGHSPSLIRVFTVHMKKAWVLSYSLSAQLRLWSDWADAQADLSLCWAHMSFCWFCYAVAQMVGHMVTTWLLMFTLTHNLVYIALSWTLYKSEKFRHPKNCCNYPKIWTV